jgi:hypothetical protein
MNLSDFTASDWSRMRSAAEAAPEPAWCGDLSDDCIAHWAGFTLRAEWMSNNIWWWCVYVDGHEDQIASSNDSDIHTVSGDEARTAALRAAKHFLGLPV